MSESSDYVSEVPGFDLIAFYGGPLHGALRFIRQPVAVGDTYDRLGQLWTFDGRMFVLADAGEPRT